MNTCTVTYVLAKHKYYEFDYPWININIMQLIMEFPTISQLKQRIQLCQNKCQRGQRPNFPWSFLNSRPCFLVVVIATLLYELLLCQKRYVRVIKRKKKRSSPNRLAEGAARCFHSLKMSWKRTRVLNIEPPGNVTQHLELFLSFVPKLIIQSLMSIT